MTKPNAAAIGAFVLGALLIAAIGIAVFFGEDWAQNKVRVVMVFVGNVSGLEVGTPVEFRGVRVGEVKRIRTIYDTQARRPRFAVYAEITGTIEIDGAKTATASEQREWLQVMIAQGMRARIETKSWVTGQQRVMLDFVSDSKPEFTQIEPNVPEIPTQRSPGEELVAELREIPFREIITDGRRLIQGLQALLQTPDGKPGPIPTALADISRLSREIEAQVPAVAGDVSRLARSVEVQVPAVAADVSRLARSIEAQVPAVARDVSKTAADTQALLAEARKAIGETTTLISDARATMAAAEKALATVDRRVDSAGGAFEAAATSVEGAGRSIQGASAAAQDAGKQVAVLAARVEQSMARLDRTLSRIDHAFSEDSALGAGLSETMREVSAAAHALRSAIDLIQRRPEALIRGRGQQQ